MSRRTERAAERASCLFMGCSNVVLLIVGALVAIFVIGLIATLVAPEIAK